MQQILEINKTINEEIRRFEKENNFIQISYKWKERF